MKSDLIAALIEKQEQQIKNVQAAIENRQESADLDEETTRDLDDFSHQEEMADFGRLLSGPEAGAEEELVVMRTIQFRTNSDVSNGALVETPDAYFLVGPVFSTTKYEGKRVVSMSKDSPAFGVNQGKTKGDYLKLGEMEFKILDIS